MESVNGTAAVSLAAADGSPAGPLQEEIGRSMSGAAAWLAHDCPSEFAFANLYLFRRVHAYRYLPGEYPCISGRAYDGTRHLLPLFDLAQLRPRQAGALLHGYDCFFPVAERTLRQLDPNAFLWWDNRDDADYRYEAELFRSFPGTALRGKRAQLKRFAAHEDVRAVPYGAGWRADALAVLGGWMQEKGKARGEADEIACMEALQHAAVLRLQGFVYFVGRSPAGFVLGEQIAPQLCVIPFAKGLAQFEGVYPFMFQHVATHWKPPIRWINFEQDLGMPNFRRSKSSYVPHTLVRKYRVRPAAVGPEATTH